MPAQAGISVLEKQTQMPACAGMTSYWKIGSPKTDHTLISSSLRRQGPSFFSLMKRRKLGPCLRRGDDIEGEPPKSPTKKAPENQRFIFVSKNLILLDLGFFEFHMLAHNWIIFCERELFSLRA
jgi:hypothetical protein